MSIRDLEYYGHRRFALLGLGLAALSACSEDELAAEEIELRAMADCPLPDDVGDPGAGPGPAFTGGVVTASESLAAQAGAEVLAAGGNAVDAAAAVQFALNVVEPQSSGIGGGGFMMIHMADWAPEETVVIDFREKAPGGVTRSMFDTSHSLDLKSSSGYAVGVPGALKGMAYAIEKYGSDNRDLVLDPAIKLAKGFPVSSRLAAETGSSRLGFEPNSAAYGEARKVFRPGGSGLDEGEVLMQPDLAKTFTLIKQYGPAAFYDCKHPAGIAKAIVATQQTTRTGNSGGKGRMSCADLKNYDIRVRKPLIRSYHGYDVVVTPPPSSGGVALLQMLGMLDRFNIGTGSFGFGTTDALNVMMEGLRLAFADRGMWIGDPDFSYVPAIGLLADTYVSSRSSMITVGKRRSGITAGDPRPWQPPPAPTSKQMSKQLEPDANEGVDTTHFTVIDGDGNTVSVSSTIERVWGTGLMVKGYGFMLNNQLTSFNDEPTADNSPYNPGSNDLAPNKRPRSSISPTMIFLDGELVAAYGSPGGTGIISALLQVTLNLIDHRRSLESSITSPRIALDSASGSADTEIEAGFSSSVRLALEKLGYDFVSVGDIGAVQAIVTYPQSGNQYGAADPRRIGAVSGLP